MTEKAKNQPFILRSEYVETEKDVARRKVILSELTPAELVTKRAAGNMDYNKISDWNNENNSKDYASGIADWS